MKAKLILTAMAMPVLFAACSSDELVPMEQTQQAERPLLSEDFKLSAKVEGQVDTRYAVVENGTTGTLKFNWENEDSYGALLVDQKKSNTDVSLWPITPGSGGNTEFVYDAQKNAWIGEDRIGIGHYLFVYPHAEADDERGAASYSLPTVQKLYNKEGLVDLNAAIQSGNKAVAAKLLKKKDVEVEIELKNLYSYPKFRINFDNGLPIETIDKVVLEHKTGVFPVAGGFAHKVVVDMFQNEETKWDEKQTADFLIGDNDVSDAKNKADELGNTLDEYTNIQYSKYIVAEFPKGTPVNVNSVTNNKEIEVRFMIPGAMATTYDDVLAMHFYTNAGVYTIDKVFDASKNATTGLYGALAFGKATTDKQISRIFARNASYTLTLDKSAVKKGKDLYMVTNADDWKELVDTYGAMTTFTETTPLEIAVVGDFTVDEEFCKNMPSKAIFKITSPVNVKDTAIVVSMPNVEVGTINVPEAATLNIAENFKAATINNGGTVNFPVLEGVYNATTTVNNSGTVNVAGKANFTLVNNAEAKFNNDGTAHVTLTNNGGTVNNNANATMKIMGTSSNNVNSSVAPEVVGVFNNNTNAKLYAEGEFTNNATFNQKGLAMNLQNGDNGTIFLFDGASTHMDNKLGKYDITNDIDAKFNGEQPTNFFYTLTANINIDVLNAIELGNNGANTLTVTIDGGTINGVTSVGPAPAKAQKNQFLGEIVIGENGGKILGAKDSENRYTKISDKLEIDCAEFTVSNADLQGLSIMSGTTTISGQVTATDVILGYYDTEDEEVTTGTLLIKDKDTKLTWSTSFAKYNDTNVKAENAVVINNGTIYVDKFASEGGGLDKTLFDWTGEEPTNKGKEPLGKTDQEKKDEKEMAAMKIAVGKWYNDWDGFRDVKYYDGNPYNYETFVNTMNGKDMSGDAQAYWKGIKDALVAVYSAAEGKVAGQDIFSTNDEGELNNIPSEFEACVSTLVTGNKDAAKALLYYPNTTNWKLFSNARGIEDATLYNTKDETKTAMCKMLNTWTIVDGYWNDSYKIASYVWNDKETVYTSLTTKFPNQLYIWKDCDLHKLVKAVYAYDLEDWKTVFGAGSKIDAWTRNAESVDGLVAFLKCAKVCSHQSPVGDAAREIAETYDSKVVEKWKFTNDQVKACRP